MVRAYVTLKTPGSPIGGLSSFALTLMLGAFLKSDPLSLLAPGLNWQSVNPSIVFT